MAGPTKPNDVQPVLSVIAMSVMTVRLAELSAVGAAIRPDEFSEAKSPSYGRLNGRPGLRSGTPRLLRAVKASARTAAAAHRLVAARARLGLWATADMDVVGPEAIAGATQLSRTGVADSARHRIRSRLGLHEAALCGVDQLNRCPGFSLRRRHSASAQAVMRTTASWLGDRVACLRILQTVEASRPVARATSGSRAPTSSINSASGMRRILQRFKIFVKGFRELGHPPTGFPCTPARLFL